MNSNKVKKCVGKEGFQRMNYLYQICNLMATESEAHHSAASLYSNLLISVSRKTVQRMEVDMKRTICKSCRCLLLAGITSKVRIKKKKIIWTCLKCGNSKIYETRKKNYLCWTQKNESLLEVLDYSANNEPQGENMQTVT